MKKLLYSGRLKILLNTLLIFIYSTGSLVAQSEDCERIRVGIYFFEVTDIVFDHLSKKYGPKSKEAWIDEIDTKMLETLRTNSPEIEFFSRRKNPDKDPHYRFQYCLHLITIDTDILIPSYANTYEDPITGWPTTEYTDPVFDSETGFWIGATLVINSPCVPNLQYIVACDLVKDLELELAMAKISQNMWRIINLIEESEKRWPVPSRGPELEISYEKEYLSLLTEEDRQMKVIAKVKNCKGEYLYRKVRSQPVYFPKDVNRCKYKQVSDCLQDGSYNGSDIVETNIQYEAKGIYIVQNGIQASLEKVPLGSCGIGSNSEIHKDGELIIRGLEVEVEPDRKEIMVDEGTEITISLYETDPDGNKYPVEGREIEVYVSGIANGKITPKGPYTTNANGEVLLTYRAGDKDTRIDLTASFQPPKYPDKAEDHSSITIKPMEYEATLFLKKKVIKRTFSHTEQSYQTAPCQNHNKDDLEFTETIEGSVYLTLKSVGSFDMFAYNQRWETYEITDIRISGFRFNSKEKKTIYHQTSGINCAGSTFEQVEQRKKILTNRKLDQDRMGGSMVVAFDRDSDEAVLILPVGAGIGYTYNEVYDMIATTTGEDGISTRTDSDTKNENDALNIEAVEDEQPYYASNPQSKQMQDYIESITGDSTQLDIVPLVPPTQQGASQEKIHPDLMVQFGDRISYFGGEGRKFIRTEIEGGYSTEERKFLWQISRKKKKGMTP